MKIDRREIKWLGLGLLLLSVFVWGILRPEGPLWGFHVLAYFPASVSIGTILVVLLLLVLSAFGITTFLGLSGLWSGSRRFSPLLEILIGVITFVVFYSLPIHGVIYGDSRNMLEWYGKNHRFDTQWMMRLFELNPFSSKEALPVLLHRSTAYLFSVSIQQAYHILSALFGGMFVTLWLLHVRGRPQGPRSGLILLVAGLLSGANAVFFGEVENYGFAILAWSLFLAAAALYFDGRLKWFWVALLFIFAVKGHAVGITFLPAMVFLLLYQFRDRWRGARWLTRPAGFVLGIVLPFLVAGLAFYILLGSYREPYGGPPERQIQRSFLPVIAAPPPMDRYTLQSPNHLIDLVNVAALVTLPASMLLLGCLLWHRREIHWSDPRILFFLTTMLFSAGFYFAVNPLLTMQRDWDLYAPLAVPMLFLLGAILPRQMPRTAVALSLGLGVFSVFFFLLNANPERSSFRIADAGRYAFRTYHGGAGFFIRMGIGMDPDPVRAVDRLRENQRQLRSMTFPNDEEFADETSWLATVEMQAGRAAAAESLLKEAAEVCPESPAPHAMLADIAILQGRIPEAAREIGILLKLKPMWVGTQGRAVRLALLTDDQESAVSHLAILDSLAKGEAMTRDLHEKVRKQWPE